MPFKIPPLNFRLNEKALKGIIAGVLFLSVFLTSYFRLFDSYENILLDARYQLRPLQAFSDQIVIIEISDDTLQQLKHWPLPRDFHASLIDVLSYYGVKQIMFDIIFTDPTAQDDALKESIRRAGNVYLPHVFQMEEGPQGAKTNKARSVIAPLLPKFAGVAKTTGFINSYKDMDGKTRWVPLWIDLKGERHFHMALKVACDYLGIPLSEIRSQAGAVVVDGQLKIPATDDGSMLINYAGGWAKTFKHYSYVDILAAWSEKEEGKTPRINLENLRGKICLVGLTATGTSDLHPIPLENDYPMVGLHANVINSILLNQYLARAGKVLNFFILVLLLSAVFKITTRKTSKPLEAFGLTIVLSVFFALFGFALFFYCGVWVDLFCPIVLMLLMNAGMVMYNFLEENRRKELIEKELSIAKTIQESFLPTIIEKFQSLEIAAHMMTAKHVGGDLYDMVELGRNKIGILIGDVSGKGVPAALVMAKTISLFRMFAGSADEPSDLLFQLNEEMVRHTHSGIFVTAAYIIYDTKEKKIQIASAGHSATLVVRKEGGGIDKIQPKEGMLLGLMSTVEFSQEETILKSGDQVVLYTDGVAEAKNLAREDFGEERLETILQSSRDRKPIQTIGTIEKEIQRFAGKAPQHDDCTIIILKEHGQ